MCNPNIRKDCKFYRNESYFRGCTILKEQICRNKKCRFYKKIELQIKQRKKDKNERNGIWSR